MSEDEQMEMIVTIVRKGWGDTVLNASKKGGAKGGTIMYGRGTGIHEKASILGMMVEPEKEIVLTIIPSGLRGMVLRAIVEATDLTFPGNGIAVVVPLNAMIGCGHLTDGCEIKEAE